jgi:hypothetical protein
MFDHVDFKAKCPRCNEEVTGFQSKHGPCMLELLWPHEADNFYSSCKKCGAWVSCQYIAPAAGKIEVEATIERGERTVGKYEVEWNPDDYPKNHPKKLPNP